MTVLRVDSLHVHYGTIHAVQGISFSLEEREIVSIVGSNGAGKSTVMWTLAGVAERSGGTVELFGTPLPAKPHEVVARGLALVPERRRLFSALTVEENLVMGAYRIFSFLCEHAALDARTFLLGAACLLLAVVGFLLARRSFRRLQYLRDNGE